MRIGILGSGLMGGKLGTVFARAGHDVVFSYARTEQKLKRLARKVGGFGRLAAPSSLRLKAGDQDARSKTRPGTRSRRNPRDQDEDLAKRRRKGNGPKEWLRLGRTSVASSIAGDYFAGLRGSTRELGWR